jgi:hypothetical protein
VDDLRRLHDQREREADECRPGRLKCSECGRPSIGKASDWRAYLTVGDEVAVYCPVCSMREFGPPR